MVIRKLFLNRVLCRSVYQLRKQKQDEFTSNDNANGILGLILRIYLLIIYSLAGKSWVRDNH
jgi:hypothetical protein